MIFVLQPWQLFFLILDEHIASDEPYGQNTQSNRNSLVFQGSIANSEPRFQPTTREPTIGLSLCLSSAFPVL